MIYILALSSRALIPLRDPVSSAIDIVAMGKARQHKAKLRGQKQWPPSHGPGPVFLSAHLLLQQFSRTGDGQVTVLVNIAHHFPECRLRQETTEHTPTAATIHIGELRLRGKIHSVQVQKTGHLTLRSPNAQSGSLISTVCPRLTKSHTIWKEDLWDI